MQNNFEVEIHHNKEGREGGKGKGEEDAKSLSKRVYCN
jgi:hypothetical protein